MTKVLQTHSTLAPVSRDIATDFLEGVALIDDTTNLARRAVTVAGTGLETVEIGRRDPLVDVGGWAQ